MGSTLSTTLKSLSTRQCQLLLISLHTSTKYLRTHEARSLEESKTKYKHHVYCHCQPTSNLKVGHKVWLSIQNLHSTCPSAKLDYKYLGPFAITEQINPVAFQFQRLDCVLYLLSFPTMHYSSPSNDNHAGPKGICSPADSALPPSPGKTPVSD